MAPKKITELTAYTVTSLIDADIWFGVSDSTNNLSRKVSLETMKQALAYVEANTAGSGTPNALTSTESFHVLTNEGTTAKNYHTLPTAVAGLVFTFVVQDADGLRVTANTADTIRLGSNVTATAGYIESTTIGDVVTVRAINATEWVGVAIGSWTNGTWTYAPGAGGGGTHQLTFTFSQPLDADVSTPVVCPIAGTITGWSILTENAGGSVEIDIWKDTTMPTVADTIVASAPPTGSGVVTSTTMTGWTTAVAANAVFRVRVDTANDASVIVFQLTIEE